MPESDASRERIAELEELLARERERTAMLEEQLSLGFPIEPGEADGILRWKELHETRSHGGRLDPGSAGDAYSYVFVPTALGVLGEVKCGSCGEMHVFRDL